MRVYENCVRVAVHKCERLADIYEKMTERLDCDEWKTSENLCMLYAVIKVMSEEQRNIVTVSVKLGGIGK